MSNRVEGERVFCYQCENEWDRAHGGLQCPRCQSEFVEILESGRQPEYDDPPEVAPESPMDSDDSPFRSLRDHNPWGPPQPDANSHTTRTRHFGSAGPGGGGTTFQFSRTYTTGLGGPHHQHGFQSGGNDPAADDIMRNFEQMVTGLLGGAGGRRAAPGRSAFGGTININGRTTHFGSGSGPRDTDFPGPPGQPDLFSMLFPGTPSNTRGAQPGVGPLGMLSMLLDPRNARSGDTVFSQEAFDRVMSQLMEQNQQNGAPPASQDLINQLPKRKINQSMVGDDGKAECSICMDNVDIGTEVTVLPCTHWFHFECIESWLKEHDTCPHCRKAITPDDQRQSRQPGQRRSSRRSSSVATSFTQMPQEGSRQNPYTVPDSPTGVRAARDQYYGQHRSDLDQERPSSERRSSRRSTGSQDAGGGGGVGGWIRSHMPFS